MSIGQDPGNKGTAEGMLPVGEDSSADSNNGTGGHPAWQEIFNEVPPEFHDAIRPTLEKWEKGVNSRFQSLHSEYEPLKTFSKFQDTPPEIIETALAFMQRVEEDPKAVWDLMGETYQFQIEQGAEGMQENEGQEPQQEEFNPEGVDPAILSQMQQLMQQNQEILQRQQAQDAAAEEARLISELDTYLEELRAERGDFDEEFVVALMAQGVDGEEAVARFNTLIGNAAQSRGNPQPTPVVMGGSGGVPSGGGIDPKSLNNSQTKDLVAQMLEQAAKESS